MPKYTAEELEAEEPTYWAARLTRQAFMAQRDPGGNIDAILQMATIPGMMKPITPLSPDAYLKGIGIPVAQIAIGLRHAKLISEDTMIALVKHDQEQRQQEQQNNGKTPASAHHRKRR
jgi:hypothetical protein